MYKNSFTKKISFLALIATILFLSTYVKSDDVDGLFASIGKSADGVNNLIATVLASSASERAKLIQFKSLHPNKVIIPNNNSLSPIIKIPESEKIEISSKFPKDYLGKYVYGPVTLGCIDDVETFGADIPPIPGNIGFWAANMRPFYLDTLDQSLIDKFKQYKNDQKNGHKFFIPKDCPLKIVKKCGFNYIVHMPFESHFEY